MPWVFVLATALIAALVAAAGDRMGHRAARRKLRIGKLRPRNVSTIIAVATGVLISLATYGVMFTFWRDFREALSNYTEVKANLERAEADLDQAKSDVLHAQTERMSAEAELKASKDKVSELSGQVAEVDKQLLSTNLSLKESDALLKKKERLQAELTRSLKDLNREVKEAESNLEGARIIAEAQEARKGEAELIVPKGAYLTYERIPADQAGQAKALLQKAINRVNIRFANEGIGISAESAAAANTLLAGFSAAGGQEQAVLLSVGRNLFKGEDLLIAFESIPLPTLVRSGDVVMDITIGSSEATVNMAGLGSSTARLPEEFGPDQYIDVLMGAYDSFVAGMAALGFLPEAPSGEWLTPFDEVANLRDALVETKRPFKIQIVSKKDATALDGLAECSIYVKSLSAEDTHGPEEGTEAPPPVAGASPEGSQD